MVVARVRLPCKHWDITSQLFIFNCSLCVTKLGVHQHPLRIVPSYLLKIVGVYVLSYPRTTDMQRLCMDAVVLVPIPMEPSLVGLTEVRFLSQAWGLHIPFITSFINNMRKIEREMIQAIIDNKDFSKANTRVEFDGDIRCYVYLHGHKIAQYNRGGSLLLNNCGYETNTTKSRLNALIDFVCGGVGNGIFQKNFNWFIMRNGETFDFPCNDWVVA